MRAAGCCINDFADRKVDGHVKRTADRPLASGRVRPREALTLFAILVGVSFLLVLCTNSRTVWLSFGAVALAFCYPFMKRYTYYPQVVLGAAYSWGIPMLSQPLAVSCRPAPGCCISPTCCGRWVMTPITPWSTAMTT